MIRELFLVFVFLVIPSILLFRARKSALLQEGIEKFLRKIGLFEKDDRLFDTHKPYSWIVQWFQWAGVPTAIMIVIPTRLVWDGTFALVLAVMFYVAGKFFLKKFPEAPPATGE